MLKEGKSLDSKIENFGFLLRSLLPVDRKLFFFFLGGKLVSLSSGAAVTHPKCRISRIAGHGDFQRSPFCSDLFTTSRNSHNLFSAAPEILWTQNYRYKWCDAAELEMTHPIKTCKWNHLTRFMSSFFSNKMQPACINSSESPF